MRLWIGPWLGGHVLIGWLGRYGGGMNVLPPWVDIAVVAVFSLIIYYDAVALGLSAADCAREVAKDARQLAPEGGAPPGAQHSTRARRRARRTRATRCRSRARC